MTWRRQHTDNKQQFDGGTKVPSISGLYEIKIYIIEKNTVTLQTSNDLVCLKIGDMFRGSSSDPAIRKMVNTGVIKKATPMEVIDDFVEEAKGLWDVEAVE